MAPKHPPGKVNVIWLNYPDIKHEFFALKDEEKFEKLVNILNGTKKHTI